MQKKIARICWNSEGWEKPSGRQGKSKDKDSYEFQNGYGHEEWLLDTSKLIDGYHYAYLQAIGQHRDTYMGQVFDISVYSINSHTKQRWWIGEIKNAVVIDAKESEEAYKTYKKNGWYDEMLAQLDAVGANVSAFKNAIKPAGFAVIKFKPDELDLLEVPLEFSSNDPSVSSDYYNLKNKIQNPKLFSDNRFKFRSGNSEKKSTAASSYTRHERSIDLIHNKIQSELYRNLTEMHGDTNVGTEVSAGNGARVDVVVKLNNEYAFYEIKTSRSVRQCIRESLGQLLEYAHYGNELKIKEFVVVGPNKITPESEQYLSTIRSMYGIPISYLEFKV